jgi:septum site-determining protein MinD
MNEKGEISKQEISGILELPVFGSVPFDAEVRKSFMQQKIAPVIIRKPDSPASIEIQKVASRLTGIKVNDTPVENKGFFAKLFSFFSKR